MGTIIRFFQLALLLVLSMTAQNSVADVIIPNVLGLPLEQAQQKLQDSGLSLGSIQNQRTNRPTGTVIVQAPRANKSVKDGYPIRLVVAIPLVRPKMTKVPNLKGLSLSQAKSAIASANLVLGKVKKRKIKMDTVEVLYQSPRAGKGIVVKSKVDLTISDPLEIKGPKVKVLLDKAHYKSGESATIKAKVSNVDRSRSFEYAFSINGRAHYSKQSTYRYTFPKSGRYIITTSFRYARGTWHASLSKTVIVKASKTNNQANSSSAPAKKEEKKKRESEKIAYIKVPNVVGLSEYSAKQAIIKSGLRVGEVVAQEDKSGKKRILKQRPRANKKVEKGTKVSLIKSIPITKVGWKKPRAIISPARIEVIQGKRVRFISKSTQDKSTKLNLSWTSKMGVKSTAKKFSLDTSKLKAGKYWIKLRVEDGKGYVSKVSALLVIKPKLLTKQEQLEAKYIDANKSKPLESKPMTTAATTEVTQNNNVEKILELKQPEIKIESKEKQSRGYDKGYLEALSIEAENTTEDVNSLLLSGSTTPQLRDSSKLKQIEVSDQHKNKNQVDIGSNMQSSQATENISAFRVNVESQLFDRKGAASSWVIWVWLLLAFFIFGVLLLILWRYRQNHHSKPLIIDYRSVADDGMQEIRMNKSSNKTAPLNPIHFDFQIDKGEQEISLDQFKKGD